MDAEVDVGVSRWVLGGGFCGGCWGFVGNYDFVDVGLLCEGVSKELDVECTGKMGTIPVRALVRARSLRRRSFRVSSRWTLCAWTRCPYLRRGRLLRLVPLSGSALDLKGVEYSIDILTRARALYTSDSTPSMPCISWLNHTWITSCSEIGGATAFKISVNVDNPTLLKSLPMIPIQISKYFSKGNHLNTGRGHTKFVQLSILRILHHTLTPRSRLLIIWQILNLLIHHRLGLL